MSHSIYPSPSHTPTYLLPDPWYEPYRGYRHHYLESVECPGRRSVAEVLWSLTATYLAALVAYGQLQFSLQGEQSLLKTLYKLVVLVIFPLYPACSLLAELFRTVRAWRRDVQRDHKFFLSRIIGLRVTRHDGSSESLDHRHQGQYSWMRREMPKNGRVAQVLILLLTSTQCFGTLIRTSSRLFVGRAFLAEDFESFFLSIGTLAILIKSWLAFVVNVEWRTHHESAMRSVDMSSRTQWQRRTGIFTEQDSHLSLTEIVTEIFLEFQTRALIVFALYLICWIVLGILSGRVVIIFAAWMCVTVLAVGWLQRAEAEAIPGGKEIFVSGFCACFFFLVPRAKYYLHEIRETNRNIYWKPTLLPWPLIVLAVLLAARILYLHYYRLPYSSPQSKMSHLGLVTFGTILMIMLPAYIFSAAVVLNMHNCPSEALPDPFWVPSI